MARGKGLYEGIRNAHMERRRHCRCLGGELRRTLSLLRRARPPKPGAVAGPMWRPRNVTVRDGTMSSNLLCSSRESCANRTSPRGGAQPDIRADIESRAGSAVFGDPRSTVVSALHDATTIIIRSRQSADVPLAPLHDQANSNVIGDTLLGAFFSIRSSSPLASC